MAAIYLSWAKRYCKQAVGHFLKGSPPEISFQVQELLQSLHMNASHVLSIYDTFHQLAQEEREVEAAEEIEKQVQAMEAAGQVEEAAALSEMAPDVPIVRVAREVRAESLMNLVSERRRWVQKLLKQLLAMGDCEETVDWDQFLWIMLKFCSLSRIELAQTMYWLIQRERQCENMHYLTVNEIQDFFFANYRQCPVKAFSTACIDFKMFPLTRYYTTDFTELLQRYTVLLNPILHLQQSLQASLPDLEFWESFDRSSLFHRRITFEFFSMEQTRVHLFGEPPFRESCDMLAPEALGPQPINQDQWVLRCNSKLKQGPMHQVSVWGEQPPPELFDVLQKQRAEREAKRRHNFMGVDLKMTPQQPSGAQVASPKQLAANAPAQQSPPTASPKATLAGGVAAAPPQPATAAHKPQQALANGATQDPAAGIKATWAGARGRGLNGAPPAAAQMSPMDLSLVAATLNEEDNEPMDVLPPRWMKHCAIAPAPRVRGPDPPLPRTFGRQAIQGPAAEDEQLAASFAQGDLPPGWSSAMDPASGSTYYYNQTTNHTQWEWPEQ